MGRRLEGDREVRKRWIAPGQNIGSGAYRLTGQVGDRSTRSLRTPSYYLGAPSVKQVKVSAVGDSTAAVARYQAGEFDAVVGLSAAAILQVKANPTLRAQFHSTPIERTVWLAMNNKKPPFNNKLVRQAFNARDRQERDHQNRSRRRRHSCQCLAAAGDPRQRQRAALARRPTTSRVHATCLRRPGYPGGKGFPSVALHYGINYGEYAQVYELIQAQLQKNLGIKVGLKELPINAFNTEVDNKKTRPLLWGYTFGFDYPGRTGAHGSTLGSEARPTTTRATRTSGTTR